MKRTKFGAIVIITITFLLGAVAGYSLTTIIGDAEAKKAEKSPYGNVSDYVKDRLNLTEDQIVKYDELVEERRDNMGELHSEYRKQFRIQIDSLRNEVRSILTEEQLNEYERFLEEYTEYRKKNRKNR